MKPTTQFQLVTQVPVEGTPRLLLKLLETGCPQVRISIPRKRRSVEWDNINDPIFYNAPSAGLLWERKHESILFKDDRDRLNVGNDHTFSARHSCSQRKLGSTSIWQIPLRCWIKCSWVAFKEAEVDHQVVRAQSYLFRRITTTEVTSEKQNKRNTISQARRGATTLEGMPKHVSNGSVNLLEKARQHFSWRKRLSTSIFQLYWRAGNSFQFVHRLY